VYEFLQTGPERVWRRLAEVGDQTRQALADVPGWAVVPAAVPDNTGCSTTVIKALDGRDVAATRDRLLAEHGVVTSVCVVGRAPREMTEPYLRISPHVDCTPDDLALLRKALLAV
jgi:pyridoxal 5-phosphate dependent beta-lyase